jgi:glutathione S-transferase
MFLSAYAFAFALAAQQPAGPITDWREAVECLAVFESTAIALYREHHNDPDGGHNTAAARWDDRAYALVESMNERFSLARAEEAERIRARHAGTLAGQDTDSLLAQAEACRSRLPDPPRMP